MSKKTIFGEKIFNAFKKEFEKIEDQIYSEFKKNKNIENFDQLTFDQQHERLIRYFDDVRDIFLSNREIQAIRELKQAKEAMILTGHNPFYLY